ENQDGRKRQAMRGLPGGNAEKADFGRGVEAQSEQEAEQISVPTAPDQREQRAKEARERAVVETVIGVVGRHPAILAAGAQRAVDLRDSHDISCSYREQECC